MIKLRWYIATTITFSSYISESSSTRRPVLILPRTGDPITLTTEYSETTIPMVVGHKQGTSLHGNQLFLFWSLQRSEFFCRTLVFPVPAFAFSAFIINYLKQSIYSVIFRLLRILRLLARYFLHGVLPYLALVHRVNLVQKISWYYIIQYISTILFTVLQFGFIVHTHTNSSHTSLIGTI